MDKTFEEFQLRNAHAQIDIERSLWEAHQRIAALEAEVVRLRTVKNGRIADLTAKIERLQKALTSAQAWAIGAEQNASAAHSGISRILSALTADLEPAP